MNWFFSCLTKLYEILKFEQFKVTLYWILTTSLQSFSPSFHSIKSLNFLIYGLEKFLNFTLPYLYEFCMLSAIYTVYIFSFHNVWPAFFNHFLLSWFSHLLCNDCYPTFSSIMFLTSIPWYLPNQTSLVSVALSVTSSLLFIPELQWNSWSIRNRTEYIYNLLIISV